MPDKNGGITVLAIIIFLCGGIGLAGYVFVAIKTGAVIWIGRYSSGKYIKQKSPIFYWLTVVLYSILAVTLFALSVIKISKLISNFS